MAKLPGSEREEPPAPESGRGNEGRGPEFSRVTEFHFNLMMLDPNLTPEELEIVDRAAREWCSSNNCECEAEATEHGFLIRLRHCEPDGTVFLNRLSDALRRDAFSQIGKGFVPA